MKVILLFALFGFSFYQARGTATHTGSNSDDNGCLPNTLKIMESFMSTVDKYLNENYHLKKAKNKKGFQDAAKGLILGLKNSLQTYKQGKNCTDENANMIVRSFLRSGDSPRDVCGMVEKLITPLCLRDTHGKLAPDVVNDLEDVHCLLKNEVETKAAAKVKSVLVKIKCTDTVELKTETILAHVLGSLGNLVNPFVGELLNILQASDEDNSLVGGLLGLIIG